MFSRLSLVSQARNGKENLPSDLLDDVANKGGALAEMALGPRNAGLGDAGSGLLYLGKRHREDPVSYTDSFVRVGFEVCKKGRGRKSIICDDPVVGEKKNIPIAALSSAHPTPFARRIVSQN